MKKYLSTVTFILTMFFSWGQAPCDSLIIVSTGGSNQAFLQVSLNLCCLPKQNKLEKEGLTNWMGENAQIVTFV